ncbi:hypothetical protein OG21DRAFT_1527015 [Imleria badia]|nr:hypothetical protein OG21DRAFT_1527015 [Imleria badia]
MFDTKEHQKTLVESENYLGKPDLALDSLEWCPTKTGQSVFDKEDEECFQAIIVGDIGSYRLNVGPAGNYISPKFGSLSKAKYQFHLTCSITSPFQEDYNCAFQILQNLQETPAVTGKHKDMLAKVIHTRDSPGPPKRVKMEKAPTTVKVQEEEMDEETLNWTVPSEHQDEHNSIKPDFCAVPLPVYRDNTFIEPVNVPEQLENSLVEVNFTINYMFIKKDDIAHDSFQAEVEQIKILKKWIVPSDRPGGPRAGPPPVRKRG